MNPTIARLITWEAAFPKRSWTIASTNGALVLTLQEDKPQRLMEQKKELRIAEIQDSAIDLFDGFVEQSIQQFHGFSGRS